MLMDVARLDAMQLDERLHDAWVDLDAVENNGDTVIVHGELEKPIGEPSTSPLGRYGFRLVVTGVSEIEVVDTEGVGRVPIERVDYDAAASALRIAGGIPGYIRVRTGQRWYELRVGDRPTHVRRFLRWRPVQTDE